jgi:hypothetical protein
MSNKYGNWVLKTPKGSDNRYTPKWLFEKLNLHFDLDVAAPIGGAPNVPSSKFLTIEDDGLSVDWLGLVWCNPPYSNPTPWIKKFREHKNGCALIPTSNGKWFHELYNDKNIVMRPIPRMKFDMPDGSTMKGTTPFVCWIVGIGEISTIAVRSIDF